MRGWEVQLVLLLPQHGPEDPILLRTRVWQTHIQLIAGRRTETQGKPCSQMKWDFRRILGMRKEAGLQQASKPRQAGGATLSPQLFGLRTAHLPVQQLNLI